MNDKLAEIRAKLFDPDDGLWIWGDDMAWLCDEVERLRSDRTRGLLIEEQHCAAIEAERDALKAENERLRELLNTPESEVFIDGVQREMGHQRMRWGDQHDSQKVAEDWFWTIGYLAGKALRSAHDGDQEKAKHHAITVAACAGQWHRFLAQPADDASGERVETGGRND